MLSGGCAERADAAKPLSDNAKVANVSRGTPKLGVVTHTPLHIVYVCIYKIYICMCEINVYVVEKH